MKYSSMLMAGAVAFTLSVPATGVYAASAPTLKVSAVYDKAGKVTGSTTKGAKITIKRSGKTLKTLTAKSTSFSANLSGLKSGQKLSVVSSYKKKTKTVSATVKKSPIPTLSLTSKKLNGNYLVLAGKTDKNAQVTVKNGTKVVGTQATKSTSYTIKIAKSKLKSGNFTIATKNLTTYGTKTLTAKINYKAPTFTGIDNVTVSKLSMGNVFNPKTNVVAKDSLGKVLTFKSSGAVDMAVNGKYTITYTATDVQGFQITAKRVVTVKNVAPTITGAQATTVNKSAKTFDSSANVVAKDAMGKTLTVTISGSVNMSKSGSYTLIYSTKDSVGYSTKISRVVTVKNDIKPTITGVSNVTVNKSTKDFDSLAGVIAKDSDGNVLKVQVFGVVLTPFPGVYELTYIATDTSGNRVSVSRQVTVTDVAPIISGIGDVTVNKSVGKFDPLAGVTAKDGDGNELEISISGNVDMSKSGVYTLEYSVEDSFGDTTTATRTVTVKNDIKPTFTGIKDLTVPVGDPDGLVNDATMSVSAQDSDGQFVDFSMSGTVNVNKVGTYVLTYSGTDKDGNTAVATQKVTVMIPETTGIQITGPQVVKVGTSVKFNAALTPTGAIGGNVTWTSGDNSIATVDAKGNVTGINSGSVLIFAEITDQSGKVWKTSYKVTVNDVIDASLYAYSQFTINNYSRQVAVSLTNTDSRTLTVTRVQINDGSFLSADFSKEQLDSAGIVTVLNAGDVFSMAGTSRVGWDLTNLNVIVTVQLPNGQTKDFTTKVN